MKDLRGVLEFVKVVEDGSFSSAARQLGMSKAYVSQKVSQLEERLGVRLLQRTTRRLSLTDAGRVYFCFAQEAIQKVSDGEEQARDVQHSLKGQIRVSMVDGGLGECYLAPALVRFAAQNLGVSFELDLSSRLVDLVEERFDFAIRVGKLASTSLIARKLTSFRFALYASPKFLERVNALTHPAQLENLNCLSGATSRWIFANSKQQIEIKPRGNWHSKSGQVLVEAAKSGLGVVRIATFYARQAIAKGELVELLPDWNRAQTPVWIVYPSGKNLPLRVRSAINFMLEDFRDIPPWDRVES